MTVVLAPAVLVVLVLYVRYGIKLMHRTAAEKFEMLRQLRGSVCTLVVEKGDRILVPKTGVVADVTERGVSLRRDGTDQFVPLVVVMGVRDNQDRVLGDWAGRRAAGRPQLETFADFGSSLSWSRIKRAWGAASPRRAAVIAAEAIGLDVAVIVWPGMPQRGAVAGLAVLLTIGAAAGWVARVAYRGEEPH
jgi:hypothetical protein